MGNLDNSSGSSKGTNNQHVTISQVTGLSKSYSHQMSRGSRIYDPLIVERLNQYLNENKDQAYVDINSITDALRRRYREYRRRNYRDFNGLVERAFAEVSKNARLNRVGGSSSDMSGSSSEVEECEKNDTINNSNTQITDMYRKDKEKRNDNMELINLSSDDEPNRGHSSNTQPKRDKMDENIPRSLLSNPDVSVSRRRRSALVSTSVARKNHDSLHTSTSTFADFGGSTAVIEEVGKLVLHLRHPEVFRTMGVSAPRGFLLHGPPGCGKTLLAAAIAGELKVPFIKVSGPELVGGVSGESEERIREMFEAAIDCAPCVLFIDEVDAVTPNRQTAQREMERRIVAQLLTSLDDLAVKDENGQVLVIGATKRPDALDPALRRAGRFDREVCLGIPDEKSRAEILSVLCRNVPLSAELDLATIARMTPGFVGADLLSLIRESAMATITRTFEEIKREKEQLLIEQSLRKSRKRKRSNEDGVKCTTAIEVEGLAAKKSNAGDTTSSPSDKKQNKLESSEKENSEKVLEIEVDEHVTKAHDNAEKKVVNTEKEKEKTIGGDLVTEGSNDEVVIDMDIVINAEVPESVKSASTSKTNDGKVNKEESVVITNGIAGKECDQNGTAKVSGETISVDLKSEGDRSDKQLEVMDVIVDSDDDADMMNIKNPAFMEKRSTGSSLLEWLQQSSGLSRERLQHLRITQADLLIALRSVQPSAKREGFATVPDVTWDDVGSLVAIRQHLKMTILGPVKYQAQFERLGLVAPAGVLLCGPPGCGKTLLAKAVANEAGINFISVKGPELLNMYVGESERAVRTVFQRARNSTPCVIFFDELDALCPRRSEGDAGAGMRVVNQMLTEMDGVGERRGVFLLAATNRPDIVDPAVLRPGRLDKTIYIGLPSPSDRQDILRAITKDGTKPPLAPGVSLEDLAVRQELNNWTGADLAALMREAAMQAVREQLTDISLADAAGPAPPAPADIFVTAAHIEQALNTVRPSISSKDLKRYEEMRIQFEANPGGT